eukprot:TRINITY_DN10484_c0_g2_i5.p1 TRINITY_DN10484_c0_g2~~TRINITY_DN10484_c0_g2_i5.p1  ORF type:complete len:502 (+),score=129.05 TRINITY_DN10484_c0_g2_i5:67-1572(+)
MAKQITQETFNDVVKENMSDFDMEMDEAIADAIEQFNSQGVDLSNIGKTADAVEGRVKGHPVLSLQDSLASLVIADADNGGAAPTVSDVAAATQALNEVRDMLASDDGARPVMAGNNGFAQLLQFVEAFSHAVATNVDNEAAKRALHSTLAALSALLDGQPDLVTPPNPNSVIAEVQVNSNVKALCQPLRKFPSDAIVQQHGVQAIKHACIMHETNRQNFIAEGLIALLLHVLSTHVDAPKAVEQAAHCLRALTLDDDVRVAFGKAHDHAKLIVNEHEGLKAIMSALEHWRSEPSVVVELCQTLARLAVRNEFCQEIVSLGGLKLLLPTMDDPECSAKVASACFAVIKAIAGNDDVKQDVHNAGGVPIIVQLWAKHPKRLPVVTNGCAAVTALCLRHSANAQAFVKHGVANLIVKAMVMHPESERLQKEACRALRNLAARNPDLHDSILAEGAEHQINIAISSFKGCLDDGKAALRDLGCKVELKEYWNGAPRDTQEEIQP